jgi:rhamnosyl/mannosyltransferase
VIAGDGPEAENVQREVAASGLRNVQLLGQVGEEDKMCLLLLCRAFVFPSHLRTEAFGMSLVEAAMSGKPMVTCEIGTGTSYVNEDGVTGWAVPPEDAQALRAAMERLLADPALAATMGAAARRRFEELFTASGMARRYEALYRELLSAKR